MYEDILASANEIEGDDNRHSIDNLTHQEEKEETLDLDDL
jgi:hypothetical protein